MKKMLRIIIIIFDGSNTYHVDNFCVQASSRFEYT